MDVEEKWLPVSEIYKHRFLLYSKDATEHLFEMSARLDSLVLSKGQILAQVKQVVKVGQGVVGFGRSMSGLFKHAITVGKRVRTETSIASGAVSVSSAAVELAVMKIPEPAEFASARILLVGAGKMGKLVIKHLFAKGCKKMTVANRNRDKVADICKEIKGVEIISIHFDQLLACAAEVDIVFTCTASETSLFLKQQDDNFPLASYVVDGTRLFIDISLPRNVEPLVGDSRSKVYNFDDLKEVVDANKEDPLCKAIEAQDIITDEPGRFEEWKDSLETVPTIKKLISYAERIRLVELEKCLPKLGNDVTNKTNRAVDDLSRGIMNRLLHEPMEHLRCGSGNGRTLSKPLENMHALNRIFALETELSLLEEKIKAKVEQSKR